MSDLSSSIPAWRRCQLWERLADSITLLVVHGIITDRDKDRAWGRMRKRIAKEGKMSVRKKRASR